MNKFKIIIPILLLSVLVLIGATCGGGEGGEGEKKDKRGTIRAVLEEYKNNWAGEGEMRLETEWAAVSWLLDDQCSYIDERGETRTLDRRRTKSTEIVIAEKDIPIFGVKEFDPEKECILFYVPDKTVIENNVNTLEIEGIDVCQNILYYGLPINVKTGCNEECSFGSYHMVIIGSRFQFDGHEFLVETDKSSNPTMICLDGEIPEQHAEILKTLIQRLQD